MDTLHYIAKKFDLNLDQRSPIEIGNVGRRQLAELFNELGFKRGVEIGVAWGFYSEVMCNANPGVELYGVDPYERQEGYIDYKLKSTFEGLEQRAHEKLDPFPNYHFVRKTSMEALQDFEDGSLDFVYIDGDHCFESVVNDIAKWSKKIRKGGIISGHDYAKHRKPGVKIHVVDAVRGYTSAYKIDNWFVLGNQASHEGLIRDKIRSWCWVI